MRSVSVTVTSPPATVTPARTRSPGLTVTLIGCEAEGTSSYQALDTARPEAVQSDSVPICSSAWESRS